MTGDLSSGEAREDGASRGSDRRLRLIVAIGALALRLLARTWRVEVRHGERFERVSAGGSVFIYALPHGHLLPLMWHHRARGVSVVISEHRDGELIARIARRLGYRTVRGSTSRGAARALLGLVRELEAGHPVAVTPDGPRGPALSFAPGAVIAAQRQGCPILPLAASASSAWRFRSWDRFMVPKPFARVAIVYGEPRWVTATTTREALDEVEEFQRLLASTVAAVDAVDGVDAVAAVDRADAVDV
ncbi:MAG TPA: lysophospholipid acyltransferase family protein [Gemmatimonadaceae bacterium]|nr:lysophospholipid acyltransferase family protein [Gemmatimonadaceae bacterium]